ncbi:MAG: ABC transporter substrate-binding protein [Lactobacillaceae bacterium]|jgi:peptide/nickel transport system substrate-binding protein|nr:ABC transporter substrate-binding protein [Lactobacillaceae bacterium]
MSKAVKWLIGIVIIAIAAVGAFFAFGNQGVKKDETKIGKFNVAYNNPDKAIKGGDIKVGQISDTPFQGSYLAPLQDDATTADMFAPTGNNALFSTDKNFKIIDGGAADIKLDKTAKTATITLHDKLTWSDGKAVTAKDVEATYEVIANNDYGSDRWTASLTNIKGLSEFHAGKADKISGITYPDGEDGKVVKIAFKELKPGMTNSGNGYFLETVTPWHQIKDIKPKDLASSPANTTKPLTFGPWTVKKVVAGQSILFEPNKYWYGAKPKLDSIQSEILAPTKAAAAVKAHKYDWIQGASADLYPQLKKVSGYALTGNQDLYISLQYFNLGHYDEEKSENVQDRDTPLQDKKVRQALAYALNIDEVDASLNNGLKSRATTVIPTLFSNWHDNSDKGFPNDIKKANKLLDEAGWKLDKKTGYRSKDGKELTLTYLARSGQSTSEAIAQNNIQQWKKVGAKVTLYHGRLQDFNTWSKLVQSNDQEWDITQGAWSLSSEPSEQDLFSKEAPFNFGHFTSDKLTAALDAVDSQKSMDATYRKTAFDKYQTLMNDEAYVIPDSYAYKYSPVNKRVVGYSFQYGTFQSNEWYAKLAVSSNTLATK